MLLGPSLVFCFCFASICCNPTPTPSLKPTRKPSVLPSSQPSNQPSDKPTSTPSITKDPTPHPSSKPTGQPTSKPSRQPSTQPSSQPSAQPSVQPTNNPTSPTAQPTKSPYRMIPSSQPSTQPTGRPSRTYKPTPFKRPSSQPSSQPSLQPSSNPSAVSSTMKPINPTYAPVTRIPTFKPSSAPPTPRPTQPTPEPSKSPTSQPSSQPSRLPTAQPSTQPTRNPSPHPSKNNAPKISSPTSQPSSQPSINPSNQPTNKPTGSPTHSRFPSCQPTSHPSCQPSRKPTSQPSGQPTGQPTHHPTSPTSQPTRQPTSQPSSQPSRRPSCPSSQPSRRPSSQPTRQPTRQSSSQPSHQPSSQPSNQPTSQPSHPTTQPTSQPSFQPSGIPTSQPSVTPRPVHDPTSQPSTEPSSQPTDLPTVEPTNTFRPTSIPTKLPVSRPTSKPSYFGEQATLSPTGLFASGIYGRVEITPDNAKVCLPAAITIFITFRRRMPVGTVFTVSMPGITSGSCYYNTNGKDIQNLFVPSSSRNFTVNYFEGSFENNYAESYISVKSPSAAIEADTELPFALDRANGLRRSCSRNTSWAVYVYPDSTTALSGGYGGELDILFNDTYPKKCFVYNATMLFSNAYPQFRVGINITLQLGFSLVPNAFVSISMPGFSNKIASYPFDDLLLNGTVNRIGNGTDRQLTSLTWSTNYSWIGYWYEGSYRDNYAASRLVLQSKGYGSNNNPFWVNIDKISNHIVPICGKPVNSPEFRISINSSNFYASTTNFTYASPIGSGCTNSSNYRSSLSQCSGHGNCDYCNNTCTCFDGYGSVKDRLNSANQDFNPDCSSRSCPIGRAVSSAGRYPVRNKTTDAVIGIEEELAVSGSGVLYHSPIECSNNGVCNRKLGVCQCHLGFYGAACDKMACGSAGGMLCSGQGRCLSMSQLARTATALPLSNSNSLDFNIFVYNESYWDANLGHECVCDSSWAVGLNANQTQQAEYFGPACQYRHCPTGDDPTTPSIDETYCEGISIAGTASVGLAGNKCHVDCSNQGTCDYSVGLCKCYSGFVGSNCGTRSNVY